MGDPSPRAHGRLIDPNRSIESQHRWPTGRGGVSLASEMKKKFAGRYVVTDPKICHGQPTFRGTRILVADVLEQVASGMAWENITVEAIAEAVRLVG
jgi:uncharacterized protein (DUF433 family)